MLTPQESQEIEFSWLSIIKLLRWDKPSGRLILLIPALWAMFLANRATPPIPLACIIILLTLSISAAGCVINDLWDQDIDAQVERTRQRPLASHALSTKVGIVVAFISLGCIVILALYLNSLSFWLSMAMIPIMVLYPLAKRAFPVPQLVLGIAWGLMVLISWTAISEKLEFCSWLLWGATVLWTLGFDTIYAISDREDDRKIGVKSSALFFGEYVVIAVAIFFAGTVLLLGWLAVLMQLQLIFWITLFFATLAWIWQCIRLYDPDLPNSVYGQMFKENVWIGFVLLFGMIAGFGV
ncbi:4-hydroxybenzoate solanesyltransferase [Plectonema cf. radiosum LEGE 06105]|uniref:4-hydroxybenzoate solanesyltransferase n=1 Tax=Plectonema cf. radiosum LEGE 06105 TaxID=945769 RepID=A0A8J7F5K3_9CYAN|nr:4-hydroxybenzoate solanesyltransferase [Plectonema radiosum]MBE9211729.1 4-hydroxybenzoate solanesyltransferase [Plectonema cf. radiosum LEGE 06105]